MSDLIKLLDGSIEDVKTGLAGKSHDDLLKLRAAELEGKKRSGALDALDSAIKHADEQRAGGRVAGTADEGRAYTHTAAIAADLDTSIPADIEPAQEVDTSGSPQQIVPDVDMSHPAVDADPRAGTTETQNRIDFNDPTRDGRQVVEDQLAKGAERR